MSKYSTDFYSWTQEQANLLKAGRLSEIDVENLIEEVESMGRSEKRALESRLTVLLVHLLKWQHQPVRRGNSWKYTIDDQRRKIQKLLSENPGLKPQINDIFLDAYQQAVHDASFETGLNEATFPEKAAFSFDKVLEAGFYPE